MANRFGLFRMLRSLHRAQRGQILVLATMILAIVLGMGALATDVGFYMHERQNVQNAVDSGALARTDDERHVVQHVETAERPCHMLSEQHRDRIPAGIRSSDTGRAPV